MAVNVTELPSHIGLADSNMLTLTGKFEFTVIITEFEVSGLPVIQVSDEVKIQVTLSPSDKVDVVNILLSGTPTLTPFTRHR